MSDLALSLDHVALVVPDLARARAIYERMGFALSLQSSHKGALTPGGPVELWGTGNHCTMFERGYFEILGVTDAALPNDHVTVLLERYAGLHLVALGCADATAAAKMLRQRLGGNPDPYSVGRDVPLAGGGTAPGAFNILHLADGAFDEADLFLIEHLTPEVLWQPEVIAQPNGVTGLAGVLICSAQPGATSARLAKILSADPVCCNGLDDFALTRGHIRVTGPDGLQRRYGGITPPVLPWVAAVRFEVADLAATCRYLEAAGFDLAGAQDSEAWLTPDQTGGAVIGFVQQP